MTKDYSRLYCITGRAERKEIMWDLTMRNAGEYQGVTIRFNTIEEALNAIRLNAMHSASVLEYELKEHIFKETMTEISNVAPKEMEEKDI